MKEQRRLAAVLAADVVGYSRLMGRDESGTLARLAVVHSRLAKGRVPSRLGIDDCNPRMARTAMSRPLLGPSNCTELTCAPYQIDVVLDRATSGGLAPKNLRNLSTF